MAKETVYVENMGGGYFEASDIFTMIKKLTDCLEEVNETNEEYIESIEAENAELKNAIENLTDN